MEEKNAPLSSLSQILHIKPYSFVDLHIELSKLIELDIKPEVKLQGQLYNVSHFKPNSKSRIAFEQLESKYIGCIVVYDNMSQSEIAGYPRCPFPCTPYIAFDYFRINKNRHKQCTAWLQAHASKTDKV